MTNRKEPEHLSHGDRVFVYPKIGDRFEGTVSDRRDAVEDRYIHVTADDGSIGAMFWPRDIVARQAHSDQRRTEETVEVPVSILNDLVYHFDVTSSMQTIPTSVVSKLAELAPDPDDPLRNHVKLLIGEVDLPDSFVDHIIKVVREYDR